jgi:hypothetical protein
MSAGDFAYLNGVTSRIPFDMQNTSAVLWMEQNQWGPAGLVSGVQALDFDLWFPNNGPTSTGSQCGHYTSISGSCPSSCTGTWVGQYTNQPGFDANWMTAQINLASNIHSYLQANDPNTSFEGNLFWCEGCGGVSQEKSLVTNFDVWLNESGYSGNGTPFTGTGWADVTAATYSMTSATNAGWVDVNLWSQCGNAVTQNETQWALANYLLLKNSASWVWNDCQNDYGGSGTSPYVNQGPMTCGAGGTTSCMAQANAVGTATNSCSSATCANLVNNATCYERTFADGLALVNTSASASCTVTLPAAPAGHSAWVDLYGTTQGASVTLAAATTANITGTTYPGSSAAMVLIGN